MKPTSSEGEHLPCSIFFGHASEISHSLHDHLCKVVTGGTFIQGYYHGFSGELIHIVYMVMLYQVLLSIIVTLSTLTKKKLD